MRLIFVVSYAPTECTKYAEVIRIFWRELEDWVQQRDGVCLYLIIDANERTAWRVCVQYGNYDRVLGAHGRDVKNNNNVERLLLSFATIGKLAITNIFFSRRKGGVSHTHTPK